MVRIRDVSTREGLLEELNEKHYNRMFTILSQYIMHNNDILKLEDKSLTLDEISHGLLSELDMYDTYVTDLGDGSLHFWISVNADIRLYEELNGDLAETINIDMSVECYANNYDLDIIRIFQVFV